MFAYEHPIGKVPDRLGCIYQQFFLDRFATEPGFLFLQRHIPYLTRVMTRPAQKELEAPACLTHLQHGAVDHFEEERALPFQMLPDAGGVLASP